MIQPFRMLLHYRAILGMKTNQLDQRGEPDGAANVVLPLTVSDNPEVMDMLLTINEGEDQSSPLTAALPDKVCSHKIGCF